MNLNQITEGIAQALYKEFGEKYQIYDNSVKQGLKEPCFLILPVDSSRNHVIGQRYEQKSSFDIHYFPKTADRSEINDIQERLYGTLEYITVESSLIRGINLEGKDTDGVLHFFVDYDMFLFKKLLEAEKMQKVEINVRKKDKE